MINYLKTYRLSLLLQFLQPALRELQEQLSYLGQRHFLLLMKRFEVDDMLLRRVFQPNLGFQVNRIAVNAIQHALALHLHAIDVLCKIVQMVHPFAQVRLCPPDEAFSQFFFFPIERRMALHDALYGICYVEIAMMPDSRIGKGVMCHFSSLSPH